MVLNSNSDNKAASTSSSSSASPCAELKSVYHDCFNRWYSEKFSKGQWDKEECVAEWDKYRACLAVVFFMDGSKSQQVKQQCIRLFSSSPDQVSASLATMKHLEDKQLRSILLGAGSSPHVTNSDDSSSMDARRDAQ